MKPSRVIWTPQPGPQSAFVTCPLPDILYGGARGGGKTDAVLGEWLGHSAIHGARARGLVVRRALPQLDELVHRSRELYLPLGSRFQEARKTWIMPGGALLRLRYLDRVADASAYQGHQYTRVYIEEATSWPTAEPIDRLRATLRSAHGVPVGIRLTANPGGPGHAWVRSRYIDPAPGGWEILMDAAGLPRVFIPARLRDNPALVDADPTYEARLRQSGSEALVRAWLEGDWNIVEGAYFDCWRGSRHVLRPVSISPEWVRMRSLDWGSARPFSVGWWAIISDDWRHPDGASLPRGAMLRYREWYGAPPGAQNQGVKMTAEQVAAGILARDGGDTVRDAVADPAIFASDGGPSIAERMARAGVRWRPADNRRVAARGAMGGWDQLRARLIGDGDGRPLIACFSTCADSIRTIPALPHDPLRPEDVDTSTEDHAADEWRYACMSRPIDPGRRDAIARHPTTSAWEPEL